jgi:hypothetical protein
MLLPTVKNEINIPEVEIRRKSMTYLMCNFSDDVVI